jgi:hypothetical protein
VSLLGVTQGFADARGSRILAAHLRGSIDDANALSTLAIFLPPLLRRFIEDSISLGELKPTTDPELLIDMLSGPLFFRWLQGHAPLDKGFANSIFDKVIPAFQTK